MLSTSPRVTHDLVPFCLRLEVAYLVFAFAATACQAESGPGELQPTMPDAGEPDVPAPELTRLWDLTGIVGTGQSLAVGASAPSVRATTQQFDNLKLDLGAAALPPFDPASAELSLVPLVEPLRTFATTFPSAYPANLYGETPHTAMAHQISTLVAELSSDPYVTVHSAVGESGQGIDIINKAATDTGSTGRAYAATLFEAEAITRLGEESSQSYGIGAIVMTHGESDAGNTGYEQDLMQLIANYNADLLPLTGQSEPIPMFVSQQHSVPTGLRATSVSTVAQWEAGVNDPNIVCSGPKYQYPYVPDAVHLTVEGYELLGEKYGQVFFERVVLGRDWQPLQPTSVEIEGAMVTVSFEVPVPPLVWEESLPLPHEGDTPEWAAGRGFEVARAGAPVPIESVEIVGDTVEITLGEDPSGAIVTVGYAHFANTAPMPGGTVRWGQLRDSDPFVGAMTEEPQPNFAVAFAMTSTVL